MSAPWLCLGEFTKETIWTWSSCFQQEVNIRIYCNSIPISSSNRKLWNIKHFLLTFPKPPQQDRKKPSRSLEFRDTVPRQDKRKLKANPKEAHIRIRRSLRKNAHKPCLYFTVRRQAPFRCSSIPKAHPRKAVAKESKDDKKIKEIKNEFKKKTGQHATTLQTNETVTDEKYGRKNEAVKIPTNPSLENKPSMFQSDTNSEFKYHMEFSKKDEKNLKNYKEKDTKFICTHTEPKENCLNSSKEPEAELETWFPNISNEDLIMYLRDPNRETVEFDVWLKNNSQNNSTDDAKKVSEGECEDSIDARRDKNARSDAKEDATKDQASTTDAESDHSKDLNKEKKEFKRDQKMDGRYYLESTDSGSEMETKKGKKEKREFKKDTKKKGEKNIVSTDADSGSELELKSEKDEKKRYSKKHNKVAQKYSVSTDAETDSEWESNRKTYVKSATGSTDDECDYYTKKSPRRSFFRELDVDSEESLCMPGGKGRMDDSDGTSIDSNVQKKGYRNLYKKTKFKGNEKDTGIGRIPSSRESRPLPPCDPVRPSPKVKRSYWVCPSSSKARHAPLPEAEWIWKLL